MTKSKSVLAVVAGVTGFTLAVAAALVGSIPLVCGLIGQELKQCRCAPKDSKLVCQETGNVLNECSFALA